jgi:hypothetical protein
MEGDLSSKIAWFLSNHKYQQMKADRVGYEELSNFQFLKHSEIELPVHAPENFMDVKTLSQTASVNEHSTNK